MKRLSEVKSNQYCVITWLIGQCARWIRDTFSFAENDELYVVTNLGKSGMIVSKDGHSYALSADAASHVKVSVVA